MGTIRCTFLPHINSNSEKNVTYGEKEKDSAIRFAEDTQAIVWNYHTD